MHTRFVEEISSELLEVETEGRLNDVVGRASRRLGFDQVPLMCAREIPVVGSRPLTIRVLAHLETERSRAELHHVYLEGTQSLRDDLPS